MIISRYYHDIQIAFEAILANKFKSMLTALGIIFGVAAVISMLAIGKGAQQEILEQMKLVGVNNIVITPIIKDTKTETTTTETIKPKQKFSPGLTLADAEAIKEIIPSIKATSPEVQIESYVVQDGKRKAAQLLGVSVSYFDLFNVTLQEGDVFNDYQALHGLSVCIIGADIKSTFFSKINPIGEHIKCGNVWLEIVGVLSKSEISPEQKIGVGNTNNKVFIPVKTMLLRYKNRGLVNTKKGDYDDEEGQAKKETVNTNQLDRIIVQVEETEKVNSTTEVIKKLMLRRHSEVEDFEVSVPELLLKQQQRTKDIFNIVLGAIAGISLLVGGIGIMNIMLASVMERTREIGTRQAIGATRKDIVVQFIAESSLISLSGGFIGIFIGIIMAKLITRFADILTVVSPFSVLIAFVISVSVGIIFGYMPAKKAAEKDPVESLRYE